MIKLKFTILFVFIITTCTTYSQDSIYARNIVDTLTSTHFWGRGYTNNGVQKAANFLKKELEYFGLETTMQSYNFSVNTFPSKMDVEVNGKKLIPGIDFIISPESKGIKANGNCQKGKSNDYIDINNRVIFKIEEKLTWSVAQQVEDYTLIQIAAKSLTEPIDNYKAFIENKFIKKYENNNILAISKGTQYPDSFLVLTAHYDHLGGMGSETYFPGANDNASGVALLLNLAKHYAKNPLPCSVAFVLFSGEEAGLLGSNYFVEHPLIPLKNIKFLLNTDLAGTGDDGITVVNASEYPKQFALMQKINNEQKLLKAVNPRGKAANSDHYHFTEKGVPSFFFYTLGGIKAYHDVFDKAATLPLNEQNDLFTLIIQFFKNL
ncbi:MAG: M28 family metallopeptidase [Chitinophagaceae bacterium]